MFAKFSRPPFRTLCLAMITLCTTSASGRALADDGLINGFRDPPSSARPRAYWFWLDGNVTLSGVKHDLEWMHSIGLGGVFNFDGMMNPETQGEVTAPSPSWKRALSYSVSLADSLGLEFTIPSSPGWGTSGGPWVLPQDAMKKLVWSETFVEGGKPLLSPLPKPPNTTGPFQTMPLPKTKSGPDSGVSDSVYYDDVATIAYRCPPSEIPPSTLHPKIKTNEGLLFQKLLWDNNLSTAAKLPFDKNGHAWVQFEYGSPQRIQSITVSVGGLLTGADPTLENGEAGHLEVSSDGQHFRKIIDIPKRIAAQETISFKPVIGSHFRVMFDRPTHGPLEQLGIPIPREIEISQLFLSTAARVNRFEDKAGFSTKAILAEDDTPTVSPDDVLRRGDMLDITKDIGPEGRLTRVLPSGRWVILRFGYSLTGHKNAPASPQRTGLEVDKLSQTSVESYVSKYLAQYQDSVGKRFIGSAGIRSLMTDSYEAGPQNWTADILIQFRRRRGYDATLWLPVLAGRVVDTAAASDRFLWDFRQTIGELIAEAHYAQLAAAAHKLHLTYYSESHENGRAFIGDGMDAKKYADIPMGAMWARRFVDITQANYDADIHESASVAHVYGKPLVAGEVFTAFPNSYDFSPETLKPIADRAMTLGLNLFVIHASAHQPDERLGPGVTLGPYGQSFTRKETWSREAKGWIDYLTRSSFLLQQGQFVADIAYFYGENTNITATATQKSVNMIPSGYAFDYVNSNILLHEMTVERGDLVTRGGMRYHVLALDPSMTRMTIAILRKIREFVRAGTLVVGPRPVGTPSLVDDENQFRELVSELWDGVPDGSSGERVRERAERIVHENESLGYALISRGFRPDLECMSPSCSGLAFVHRATNQEDIYFISNRKTAARTLDLVFRTANRIPELWRADTGKTESCPYQIKNGQVMVQLRMSANDALFLVFRQKVNLSANAIADPPARKLANIDGSWLVTFQQDRGAPASANFYTLDSWAQHREPGIRYFSGTATYHKTLDISAEWISDYSRIELDLGVLKDVAEVLINGRSVGVLWKDPYLVDITEGLHIGRNQLEIRVTNLWHNRLIGDKQTREHAPSVTTWNPFKRTSKLLRSGLLGPVSLLGSPRR
jgi:(4-O-methyl)-D-glucuronate---lignin esterase